MTAHSFVDESKSPTYLLAALVRPANIAQVRQEMAGMVLPRQRRIHFNNERDSRRSQIMARVAELPIEAAVYEACDAANQKVARRDCLAALVRDHIARDVRHLVLERDDSLVEFDRERLRAELQAGNASDRMRFHHARAFEEPLLAIADAVAWCWGRGGHWRVKAKSLVTSVHQA